MSRVMEGVDRLTRIAGQNRLEMLLFRLHGPQVYGINVFKVREVLKCPTLRCVPQANAHVCGVMHTRGQTVTVIDLASVIGSTPLVTPLVKGDENHIIITEYNGRVQGYLVAQVERIVNLRWDEIHAPPKGIGKVNYLTAVVTIDNKLVEILDVERVLAEIVGVGDEVSPALRNEPLGADERPRHIFVADDSAVARKQITRVLDQLGYSYDLAESGEEAWTRLKAVVESGVPITQRYAMLISDIEMPEMDGYTLTKAIKADPDLKALYVCLHTSLSGGFNQAMAQSVGADKLVPKFVADDLAAVIVAEQMRRAAPAA